ncbi:MAG: hypothetical protein ABW154_11205 [Dyella sp.]
MNHLHSITVAAAMAMGLCTNALAQQQSAAPTPANEVAANTATKDAPKPLPAPGDRNCIRDTGSLIKPKPGHCLNVPGRSYSQEDLRSTGQIDNARALQQLDPSISIGH